MKFPFRVYLDKLEGVAKAAPQGMWSSPRASLLSLRQIVAVGSSGLPNDQRVLAEYVPAEAMRHIVESQPRAIIALIGTIRVLADRVAELERHTLAPGAQGRIPREIEVPE